MDSAGGRGGRGPDSAWTRGEFLRRAAGGAGLLLLAGGGAGAYELLEAGRARAAGKPGNAGVQVFRSRPDLKPPVVDVLHTGRGIAPGYLFIAPHSGPGQSGVMLLDNGGEVVWFHPTGAKQNAANLRAAVYRGKPVLTWWEGRTQKGIGYGECVIADQSYREIARFRAGHDQPADLHELLLTPRNTALVTAKETRTMDLTSIGGRKRWPVIGSVVQELEIPSARVLFEWRSLDHVALAESHQKIGPKYDYFHVNSIAIDFDGNLIVSARNTWAVYKISRRTGEVLWRLGGKKSDFAMGKGTRFAWQHDARAHDGGRLISVFDDGAAPAVESQSRALLITLDTKRMRASLARRYTHHPPLLARYTGSAQLLPNGNVLVGWGSQPYFTEFARDGAVRFDARLPRGGETYRALRFPWTGRPAAPPALVAVPTAGNAVLYASWNGATEVASWQLHTGSSPTSLRPESTMPRVAFETELPSQQAAGFAAVVALDSRGRPLGRSAAIKL
jgi:hypothetical protein